MATDQIAAGNRLGDDCPLGERAVENLRSLLELAHSEITLFSGDETLPLNRLLLDALLSLLEANRPDLFAHSQRVALLCFGMGRHIGWSHRHTLTLATAGMLHQVGTLTRDGSLKFWDTIGTAEELQERRVLVDLLQACHADSDLLDLLELSHNFGYRAPQPEERTRHVIEGAACLQLADLFDSVRQLPHSAPYTAEEIVGALQAIAEMPAENLALDALQAWLRGDPRDREMLDPQLFQITPLADDPDTAEEVRSVFLRILRELRRIQDDYDGFFLLDSTGHFQLWSSGCAHVWGRSVREMRNKYWTNPEIGYCNEEGISFSDSQTPLYRTLETARRASTVLFLRNAQGDLRECDVTSVPLIGPDRLLQGIVELHKLTRPLPKSDDSALYEPQWLSELAGEMAASAHVLDEDPNAESAWDSFLMQTESSLSFRQVLEPPEIEELALPYPATDEGDEAADVATTGQESLTVDAPSDPSEASVAAESSIEDAVSEAVVQDLDTDRETETDIHGELVDAPTLPAAARNETWEQATDDRPAHEVAEIADVVPEIEPAAEVVAEVVETTSAESSIDEPAEAVESPDEQMVSDASNLETAVSESVVDLAPHAEVIDDSISEVVGIPVAEFVTDTPADSFELVETAGQDAAEPPAEEATLEAETLAHEVHEEFGHEPALAEATPSETLSETQISAETQQPDDEPAGDPLDQLLSRFDKLVDEVSQSDSVDAPFEPAPFESETVEQRMDVELVPTAESVGLADASMESVLEEHVSDDDHPIVTGDISDWILDDADPVVAGSGPSSDFVLSDMDEHDDPPDPRFAETVASVSEPPASEEVASADIFEIAPDDTEPAPLDPPAAEIVAEPASQAETVDVVVPEMVTEDVAVVEEVASEAAVIEEVASEEVHTSADVSSTAEETPFTAESAETVPETNEWVDAAPVAESLPAILPVPPVLPIAIDVPQPACPSPTAASEPQPVAASAESDPPVPQTVPPEAAPAPDVLPDLLADPVSRNEWEAFVLHLLARREETRDTFAVLFVDIDHFGAINKEFGRTIGDDLILEVDRRIAEFCERDEMACRLGGEQFVVACPGADRKLALVRAERFRKLIASTKFDVLPIQKLTVSIGVTLAEENDDLKRLLDRCEEALSRAKRAGRNACVAISSDELQPAPEEVPSGIEPASKPMQIDAMFEAFIASNMIIYKLGGFLYDSHAKLLKVDKRHVAIRVGKKGLFPYWGKQPESQPVLIDLELAEDWDKAKAVKGSIAQTTIRVRMRPDGWVRKQDVFEQRAFQILRDLKAYFAAR